MSPVRSLLLACCLVASPILTGAEEARIFPPGDSAQGEPVFLETRCYRCHTLESRDLPDFDLPASLKIHLGGDAHALWSRDQFAQAIMDPEHLVAPQYQAALLQVDDPGGAEESPMPSVNHQLTVQQLIDLASFLAMD